MEAFEQFVALAMEDEGLVVSEAIKFPVERQTARADRVEIQTHGYEVDLVGANSEKLVLATVKSFFGSRGTPFDAVAGTATRASSNRRYALLNDPVVRTGVVTEAAKRFGYNENQIELRLYVGKFAGSATGIHEQRIKDWCAQQIVGSGPVQVFGIDDVVNIVRRIATSKTYRDNAVLVTLKVLDAAGLLKDLDVSVLTPSDEEDESEA